MMFQPSRQSAVEIVPGGQITFYVSPDGNDANPGTGSSASGAHPGARVNGQNSLPVCVYDASMALQAGKTVTRVVLPDVGSGVTSGNPSLRIFAVTIR